MDIFNKKTLDSKFKNLCWFSQALKIMCTNKFPIEGKYLDCDFNMKDAGTYILLYEYDDDEYYEV